MKSAVVVFPGINRETDMMLALEKVTGSKPVSVWHTETEHPKVDLVVLPGGFSYGDYLRCGAIAARSPIMEDIRAKSLKGLKRKGWKSLRQLSICLMLSIRSGLCWNPMIC